MSYRKPTTKKSAHGVAPGWPIPTPTPLSQDLDRAAARRAAERLAEPYVPSTIQQPSQPAKEQPSMSFTSSRRVKIKLFFSSSLGKKRSGKWARVLIPADIIPRLGPKVEDIDFDVVIDDDGILLRPTNADDVAVEIPSWAE